jgi:hypothetical protein
MQRRVALLAALPAALLGPARAPAQQNPFVGSWRGAAQVNGATITFNTVMGPDLHYSQQQIMGRYMTTLSGPYAFPAANVVAFQVEDWQPRTLPVYHATGTTGGYYTQEPVPRPPGGVFRYKFTSPNSVTLQDTNLGGTVTFNRVR